MCETFLVDMEQCICQLDEVELGDLVGEAATVFEESEQILLLRKVLHEVVALGTALPSLSTWTGLLEAH